MKKTEILFVLLVFAFVLVFGYSLSLFQNKQNYKTKYPQQINIPNQQKTIDQNQVETPEPIESNDSPISQEEIKASVEILEPEENSQNEPIIKPEVQNISGVEIIYDSSNRLANQEFPAPFTKKELSIYKDKYSVTIEDQPNCQGSILSNIYIVELDPTQTNGFDHIILTIKRSNINEKILDMWNDIPKDACGYYKETQTNSIQIQEIIQSYRNLYQIQDLEKIQFAINKLNLPIKE